MSGSNSHIATNGRGARKTIGRFAPSPTGELHAGNISSYLMAWLIAKRDDGDIVLRIEDLDPQRSKKHHADKIMRDLESLGLYWDEGPIYQSDRDEAYLDALEMLRASAHVYPCFCTRADLHSANAPHVGERYIYSGKCRELTDDRVSELMSEGRSAALRLEMPDLRIGFQDAIQGHFDMDLAKEHGDITIRRSDGVFAYQLAVVVDDAMSGVSSVVRGVDLLDSTPPQMHLQRLLGYKTPEYAHVPLFVDNSGRRLSKRNEDAGLDEMLARFHTPEAIIGHIAYLAGVMDEDTGVSPTELLAHIGSRDVSLLLKDTHRIVWQ